MVQVNSAFPNVPYFFFVRSRRLHEAGLVQKKLSDLVQQSWYSGRREPSTVHTLSTDDTAALFYMALLCLAVATIVFFLELLVHPLCEKKHSLVVGRHG